MLFFNVHIILAISVAGIFARMIVNITTDAVVVARMIVNVATDAVVVASNIALVVGVHYSITSVEMIHLRKEVMVADFNVVNLDIRGKLSKFLCETKQNKKTIQNSH